MPKLDFASLADELDSSTPDGPTVADSQREQRILDLLERLSVPQSQSAPVVHVTSPAVEVPAPQVIVAPSTPPPRSSWRFEFERNADGTIKSITANPI